jgi:hypothetical protein
MSTWKQRAEQLEAALNKLQAEAQVLWDASGYPVYEELADLCQSVMDAREVLVDQSEAERR